MNGVEKCSLIFFTKIKALGHWSAVDDGHVPVVMALADRRREVVQPLDLLGAQLDAEARVGFAPVLVGELLVAF